MLKNNNIIYIFILIIISILLTIFVIPNYFQDYAKILNLIIWIVIFVAALPIKNEHTRFKAKSEKIKTVVIIVILYYIVYLLLGLVYGYSNSPYGHGFINIIKNLTFIFTVVLLQEYVRAKLVNSTNKMYMYIIITAMFFILKLNYNNFSSNFTSGARIFEYFSSVIFVEIMLSCLYTFLCTVGGYMLSYAYAIPTTLATLLLPIFPNIDWFMTTAVKSVFLFLIFLFVNFEQSVKVKRYTRREIKSMSPYGNIPSIIIVMVFVAFVAGILPYRPIAIMSYSMVPSFSRGDIVISKKLDSEDIKNLKVNDVIEYKHNNSNIIHRIISIKRDINGELLFITKGDNNKTPDRNPVKEEQVTGLVKYMIPLIGYPSVWFSEVVFSAKSVVEI